MGRTRCLGAHGPAYDPITRMRTHSETGQMVGLAFFTEKLKGDAPVGVGVLTVTAGDRPSAAIAQARAMSRAAWSYPSRIACRNQAGHVAEVSQPVPA